MVDKMSRAQLLHAIKFAAAALEVQYRVAASDGVPVPAREVMTNAQKLLVGALVDEYNSDGKPFDIDELLVWARGELMREEMENGDDDR